MLTLYSMNGCTSCVSAERLLERHGVNYKVVKIDEDEAAWEFLKSEGHRSMPQVYEGSTLFVAGGYSGLVKLSPEAFDKFK